MNLADKNPVVRHLTACNLLIAANIAVSCILAAFHPSAWLLPSQRILIDAGGNYGLLTLTGEYWRLFTYMFVHVGVVHLAVNMYSLWCVGTTAESLFGWRMFLLIYLFSGVIAALTSMLHDPLNVSAGASGAILGVFGSLLAFLYVQRDKYPKQTLVYHGALAVGLFFACLLIGLMVPGIDNFAHAGGFIGGAFAGLLLARLEVRERWRIAYAVPTMMLMGALWALAIYKNFENRGFGDYNAGLAAVRAGNFQEAVEHFTAFIDKNPAEPDAYGSRGIAYSKLNQLDLAAADFARVIALSPDSAEPYNSRAWVENGMRRYELAVKDASLALKLRPNWAATLDTRGFAYAKLGLTDKALADFADGIRFDPNDSACHYHRMKLYEELGRLAEAQADRASASRYQPEIWER